MTAKHRKRRSFLGLRHRTVLGSVLTVFFTLTVGVGAAFGYWVATDHSNPAQADAAALSAPSAPSAMANSSTAITVGWSLPGSQLSGAEYQVTRTSGPGSPLTVCQLSSTSTSCQDTNLVPGTTYGYSTTAIYPSSLWQSSAITASATTLKVTPSISTQTSNASLTVGSSVSDQATFSGGYSPSGTVTWKAYASSDTACTSPLFSFASTKTVSGDSTYASGALPTAAVGSYIWGLSYSGDTSNNPVSQCGGTHESFTVSQATPQISTTASASVAVGSGVTDQATLSNGYDETGTITYALYGPSTTASCTAGDKVMSVTNSSVSGNGNYTSPSITPPNGGTYWWIASYGGDGNNAAASDTCGATSETVAITKATPVMSSMASAPSFQIGGSVSDSATLTVGYSATGTITWKVYNQSDTSCATPLFGYSSSQSVSGNGPFSPAASVSPTAVGSYMWGMVYSGDTNNNAVTVCGGTNETFTVSKGSPVVSASASSNSLAGTPITPSAPLGNGVNPAGTISFKVFGPQSSPPTTCTTGGTTIGTAVAANGNNTYNANASYSPSAVGDYWWYTSFSDNDGNNNAAVSTCGAGMTETAVAKASPTLSVSAPSTDVVSTAIGSGSISATLAATSGSNDANVITFKVFGPQTSAPTTCTSGGTTVGTATPAGNGTYNPSAGLTPSSTGDYWWYVSAASDANNAAANSTCGSGMTETVVSGLTITSVQTDGTHKGAPYVTFSGAGANGSNKVTVTVCDENTWPCPNSGNNKHVSATATTSSSPSGPWTTGQSSSTLSYNQEYYAESTEGSQTSPVFDFTLTQPTPTAVTLTNGGTARKVDSGDTVSVTFNEQLDASTICSAWNNSGSQSVTDASITITDSYFSGESATATSSTCGGDSGSNFGTIYTGTSYVAPSFGGNSVTFSGSKITWNPTADTLTFTLGTLSSGGSYVQTNVSAGTPGYAADGSMADLSGDPANTSTFTSNTTSGF